MRTSTYKIAMLNQLDSLYELACVMTRCSGRAKEVTHLSFEMALNRVRTDNCIASSPRVLLFRSLYQALCIDGSTEIADVDSAANPMEATEAVNAIRSWKVDWESYADQLKPALESLPTGLRFVLYLWASEDVPLHEIADVLGVCSSEVCTRLQKARDRLCQLLMLESQDEIPMSAPEFGYSFQGESKNM